MGSFCTRNCDDDAVINTRSIVTCIYYSAALRNNIDLVEWAQYYVYNGRGITEGIKHS
jgi:hypothetical protein